MATGEAKVGWVWDVDKRSSFDILWSCLAVVLVCTYKVIHLNLPSAKEVEAPWYALGFWRKWLRKFKWMTFMTFAPEILLAMALQDWLWCRQSVRDFERSSTKNESPRLNSTSDGSAINTDVQTMSIVRSMPRHVPLRYARRLSRSLLSC